MSFYPLILLSASSKAASLMPHHIWNTMNNKQLPHLPVLVSLSCLASQRQCNADLLSHPAHEELRNDDNVLVSYFNSNTVG